ncbi:MAG: excinuclease ABC subunit UvrB [Candidatus Paceibacteria bacterium]
MNFKLKTNFKPTGDQPQAIKKLVSGLLEKKKYQVLLGVTGSGKTYTLANVIEKVNLPTIVISPNKILAAQLYQEFREFFPGNAVHYFVSYYDYYQPEAYIPQTDTYIEKDAKINDLIDQLRHAATADVLSRKDVIVVASVSCIYGIGDPEEYENISLDIAVSQPMKRSELIKFLTELQYQRNDYDPKRGEFRVRGDLIEIILPHGQEKLEIDIEKNKISSIRRMPLEFKLRDPRLPKYRLEKIRIFPAKHFVIPRKKLELAIKNIEAELEIRLKELRRQGKLLEAERLSQRTNYDLEILRESGYCPGIENYSRHLSFRKPGEPPFTLIDYFSYANGGPDGFLTFIDESHLTIPQIRAMAEGDRARKEALVEFGFRLPSCIDNRPLTFTEFKNKIGRVIYVSATPTKYEKNQAGKSGIVEQLVRPTGILDPKIKVKPTKNQVSVLISEIKKRVSKKERVLVLTLTKRLAEDLAEYLSGQNIKVHWIHSEIKTLARPEILRDLRLGNVDVIVGVNLIREGLDLPEVSLVAILDADKEGFLRNETTLIQTMGRAARHVSGEVILFADTITRSMKVAISETKRRRRIQALYNRKFGIKPKPITKPIRPPLVGEAEFVEKSIGELEKQKIEKFGKIPLREKNKILEALEKEMWQAAKNWDFERAAKIRSQLQKLKGTH